MKNKIGVTTSTYRDYSLEDIFKNVSKNNLKYIELSSKFILDDDKKIKKNNISKISNLSKKYGPTVYCLAAHGNFMNDDSVDIMKRIIDACVALNSFFITMDTGIFETKQDREKFYNEIRLVGDYAMGKNITICIEIHGDWFDSGESGSKIIKEIDYSNIRLNYDTGNVIYYSNKKPDEDIVNAIPYISFMHLKDKIGGYKEYNFPYLGRGEINFKRIFELVNHYTGPISVEIEFNGNKQPLDKINNAIKKSLDFLGHHINSI